MKQFFLLAACAITIASCTKSRDIPVIENACDVQEHENGTIEYTACDVDKNEDGMIKYIYQ